MVLEAGKPRINVAIRFKFSENYLISASRWCILKDALGFITAQWGKNDNGLKDSLKSYIWC